MQLVTGVLDSVGLSARVQAALHGESAGVTAQQLA